MALKWILPSWIFLCSAPFWGIFMCRHCSAFKNPPYFTALLNVTVMTPNNASLSLSLERGRYGLESPKRPVTGLLLEPMPIDGATNRLGCDPRTRFQVPPGTPHWIALLQRGNCTFREKVLRAASQNVSAVVIYNNVPGADHVTMTHQGTGEIVAVMISQHKVEEILGHLEKNRTVFMSIGVGTHLVESKGFSHSSYFDRSSSLLFLAIPFIILALISLAWVLFYFIRKIRHKFVHDPNQLMEMSKEEGEASLYEEYSV